MTNWQLYRDWLEGKGVQGIPMPDQRGLFRRGSLLCFLPFFRIYWKAKDPKDEVPQTIREWPEFVGGRSRFFRADQALDWLAELYTADGEWETFARALREALKVWLIPVDWPLAERANILGRRVEAIRVLMRKRKVKDANIQWLEWSRRPNWFPDDLRRTDVKGLDPVHTPESDRAGLTRYLSEGWDIDGLGQLKPLGSDSVWGPSTSRIPYKLHDAPRRLMLGASLQARAVPLGNSSLPRDTADIGSGWFPPGRNLRVVFSALNGWTHEDAMVISESAALNMTRVVVHEVHVLVPSQVAYFALEVSKKGERVVGGQTLLRAYLDLYASGLRRHDAEEINARDGWVEISVPGSEAPEDGELIDDVHVRVLRTPKWRASIVFKIEARVRLDVGDKLATRHGIKGVVSKVLSDKDMPDHPEGKAEVAFSPVGVIRRGALGQFHEATAGTLVENPPTDPPRTGNVFVLRQPQDARPRCRVRGAPATKVRGQRYGEMEFWALMAYGADKIAGELLSAKRSTARWMALEALLLSPELQRAHAARSHRYLATQALNRYLGLLGIKLEGAKFSLPLGRDGISVKVRASAPSVINPSRFFTDCREALDHMEDEAWFLRKGGSLLVDLRKNPVRLVLKGHQIKDEKSGKRLRDRKHQVEVNFEAFEILPPWLRPASPREPHPLTRHYESLLSAATFGRDYKTGRFLRKIIEDCLKAAFDEKAGAAAFLRREVLGRRLTRSARAVIVPDPELCIDQISLPQFVYGELFAGLPDSRRELVLVNRNPTLHRRGLLALRPIADPKNHPVFRLPLGILAVLGADFDGDQVCVVVLETQEALEEARSLLPGSAELRSDPFRSNTPAFPLLRELSCADEEWTLAAKSELTQNEWCAEYHKLVEKRRSMIQDGWSATQSHWAANRDLWVGLPRDQWLQRAQMEMMKIYEVRQKSVKGGILRRELYRRRFSDQDSLKWTVAALQAVTERLTQSALSVKTAEVGDRNVPESLGTGFNATTFFENPSDNQASLYALDTDMPFDAPKICEKLGRPVAPKSLLAWLARPSLETLVDLLSDPLLNQSDLSKESDPRIAWFLA